MLSIYLLCVGSRPGTSGLYVGACFLPIYCALALALPPRVYTWGRAFYLLIVRWLSACYLGSILGCVLSIYLLCVGSRPASSGLYVGACFLSTYCALPLGLLPRVYTWVRAFYLLIVHCLSACYIGSILECVLSIYLLCVVSRPATSGLYVSACYLPTYCALALGLLPRVYTWVRAFYLLIVHWFSACYLGSIRGCVLSIYLLYVGYRPATSGLYVSACFLPTYCALALGLLPRVYTWVRAFYLLILRWLSACYLGSIREWVLSTYLLCFGSRPATSGKYVGACFLSTYCALALGLLPRVNTWVRAFYLLIVHWFSACYLGSIRGCVLFIYLLCVGSRPDTSGLYVSAWFLPTYCALALGLLPRVYTWVRAFYLLIVRCFSACYLGSIRECVLPTYLLCVGSRPATSGLYVGACFLSTYCALALGLLPRVYTWVRAFYLLIVRWLSACYLESIRECVLSIYLLCVGSRPASSGQYVGACFLSTYCALALGLLPRVNTWVRAFYLLIVHWLSACYLWSIRGCELSIYLLCIGSRPATSGQYVGACFLPTYCALALGLLPRVITWVRAFYLLIVRWPSACYIGSIRGCVLSIYLLCIGSRPATSGQYVSACFLPTYCALVLGLLPRVNTWVRAFYLLIVHWLSACYLGSIRGCVLSTYLLCVGSRPATSGQYVIACFLPTYCALALGLLPRVNTWVRAFYLLIVRWLSACYLGSIRGCVLLSTYCALALGLLPRVYTWVRAFYLLIVRWLSAWYLGSIRGCVLSTYLLCVGSRPATTGLYVGACFLSTYCALALGLLPRVNTWVRAFYLLIVRWLSACYLGSIRGCVLSIYLLCVGSRPATSGLYVSACFLPTYCALALGLLHRVYTWVRAFYLLIVRCLSACYLGSVRECVLSTYLLCIGSRPATSGLYVSACFLPTYCALVLGLLPRVNTWVRAFYLLIVRWLSACYLGSIRECVFSTYLLCIGSRPATSGLFVSACFLSTYFALSLGLLPRVYTWVRAIYLLIVHWLSACYLGTIRGCVLSIYLLCVGSLPATSVLYVGACFISTYCALALGLLPRVNTWVRAFYLLIVLWLSACFLGSIRGCVLSIYLLCIGSRPATSGQYVSACFLSTYCALALGLLPRVNTWVRAFYLLIVRCLSACYLGSIRGCVLSIYLLCISSRPATSGQYVGACFLSTYCALALGLLPRVYTWVRAFYLLIVRWLSAYYLGSLRGCVLSIYFICVGSRPAPSGLYVSACFLSTLCALALGLLPRVYTWVLAFYLLIVRWLAACYLGSLRECVLSIYLLCVASRPATSGLYVGAWFLSTYCALALGLLPRVYTWVCAFYLLIVRWLSACYLGSIRECVLSTYLLCIGSRPATSGLYVSACFLPTYCALALGLLPRVNTWVRAFYLLIVRWLSACYLGSIRGCVLSIYLLCVASRPATSGLYVSACFLPTYCALSLGLLHRVYTWVRAFYLLIVRCLSACYLGSVRECVLSTYLLCIGSRPATSGLYVSACFLPTYCALVLGLLPRVNTWVRAFYLLIVRWLSACYLGSIRECVLSTYLLCIGSRPATSGLYVSACFLSTYFALALGLLPRVYTWVSAFYLLIVHWLSACYLG